MLLFLIIFFIYSFIFFTDVQGGFEEFLFCQNKCENANKILEFYLDYLLFLLGSLSVGQGLESMVP